MVPRSLNLLLGAQAELACKIRIPPPTVARLVLATPCTPLRRPHKALEFRRLISQDERQNPLRSPASEKAGPAPNPKRQSVLDRMGATRTVKIVVIVFICIYGTMETIFYAGALYRYFTNKPTGESAGE